MNRRLLEISAFGLLFLFFIQLAGMLVESIYTLDLLKSALDAKVLGVLFFFSPVVLLFFGKRVPRGLVWLAFALLFIARGMTPFLMTMGKMVASGVGTSAALILITILLSGYLKSGENDEGLTPAQGLALAIGISIFLRTLNFTFDISLTKGGGWLGWVLGIMLGVLLGMLEPKAELKAQPKAGSSPVQPGKGVASGAVGILSVLTLVYFAFASPGVIARWTESNYTLVIMAVSFFTLLFLFISLVRPGLINQVTPPLLLGWNALFAIALTGTILAHTIRFPAALDSPAVVVGAPVWYQQIPLVFMLVLFPVIFLDFAVCAGSIALVSPSPRKMTGGFLLGSFILVVLVFANIFTNVWGYVQPVSTFFRNKYFLPFSCLIVVITLIVMLKHPKFAFILKPSLGRAGSLYTGICLLAILFVTFLGATLTDRHTQSDLSSKSSLLVMTYNIQQANDVYGEQSLDRQLGLIMKVNPDILGLQETDSTRISLGNNDIVRYFASKLGYYSYYGPKTVTGTYGTAVLSRYPLENPLTFFTFSDQDEIGTVEVQIVVGDKRFTIYDVHPDGTDEAKLAFARVLLSRLSDKENVIAVGDYNSRGWEDPYTILASQLKNAWMSIYPTGIDQNGLDMSGRNRIDHIFVSPHLAVSDPVYLLPPASGTDHPAHWAIISW